MSWDISLFLVDRVNAYRHFSPAKRLKSLLQQATTGKDRTQLAGRWTVLVKLLPGLLQQLEIGGADDDRRRLAKLDNPVLGLAVVNFVDDRSKLVA